MTQRESLATRRSVAESSCVWHECIRDRSKSRMANVKVGGAKTASINWNRTRVLLRDPQAPDQPALVIGGPPHSPVIESSLNANSKHSWRTGHDSQISRMDP